MARRRIADEPISRLAIWARRCALFSLVATVLAIVHRALGPARDRCRRSRPSAARCCFAVLGIVLALGAFVVIWKDGIGGLGHAFHRASASALALLAYPAYLGYRAYKLPMINDITTDPIDPPRFDVLARLRPRAHRSTTPASMPPSSSARPIPTSSR